MIQFLLKFFKEKKASVAVEFALVAPFLIIITAGIYDVTYLFFAHLRTQRLANLFANTISIQNITEATLESYIGNATNIAKPLDFSSGSVVVSNINIPSTLPTATQMAINWQYSQGGSVKSKLGAAGQKPINLPNSLQLGVGQEIVVTEVYYTYKPLIKADFLNSFYSIYKIAIFPVRVSSIASLLKS